MTTRSRITQIPIDLSYNRTTRDTPPALALVLSEQVKSIHRLSAAADGNLQVCTTVEEFLENCVDLLTPVMIISIDTLHEDLWQTLWSFIRRLGLQPSIVLYSQKTESAAWPEVIELDTGEMTVVVSSFIEERLREAISRAAAEYLERSQRLLTSFATQIC
jgi:hypothetical protein